MFIVKTYFITGSRDKNRRHIEIFFFIRNSLKLIPDTDRLKLSWKRCKIRNYLKSWKHYYGVNRKIWYSVKLVRGSWNESSKTIFRGKIWNGNTYLNIFLYSRIHHLLKNQHPNHRQNPFQSHRKDIDVGDVSSDSSIAANFTSTACNIITRAEPEPCRLDPGLTEKPHGRQKTTDPWRSCTRPTHP